ncbi:GNAT family N-acetyltransferase [Timonella senegalensis]|uniref:GNAT family N-acetyltransferase n=1 Tax=Timonella senegalensis TaxID=1465825 RepID=UPI0028AC06AC|nr:GNAT family N-acetyltransferase [Timonella senegalensis]
MSEIDDDFGFDIVQDQDGHRFNAVTDDGKIVGHLEYEVIGQGLFNKIMAIPSVVTKPEFRGHGIASELATEAFSWARKIGATVDPICPFIADYIENNPVYQDLLDGPSDPDEFDPVS